jgi:hypothetical protein
MNRNVVFNERNNNTDNFDNEASVSFLDSLFDFVSLLSFYSFRISKKRKNGKKKFLENLIKKRGRKNERKKHKYGTILHKTYE